MIHGGGHVMLSRKDIRPAQTSTLLDAGFLPISIDYRLCPELTILEGPMHDVRDALKWARSTLLTLPLQRRDIRPNGDKVVAIGWSTGGHLAMTLGMTSLPNEIHLRKLYLPSTAQAITKTSSGPVRTFRVVLGQRRWNTMSWKG